MVQNYKKSRNPTNFELLFLKTFYFILIFNHIRNVIEMLASYKQQGRRTPKPVRRPIAS